MTATFRPELPKRLTPLLPTLLLAALVVVAPLGSELSAQRRTQPARSTSKPEATAPKGVLELRRDLSSMLDGFTRNGQWGAAVVSLTRGDTLFQRAADTHMMPASTMKLYTAALALDTFGPEHRFSTDLLHDGPVREDNVVEGNLYLRGAGDPALAARFMPGRRPDAAVDALARIVRDAGITHIRGDVVGDATLFEHELVPEGWQTRYLSAGYAARVSALSLNENLVTIAVEPMSSGSGASVRFEPQARGLRLDNQVRTVAGRGANVVAYTLADGTILARGTIGRSAGVRRYNLVVEEPARYAAGALLEALRRAGVQVDGGVALAPTPSDAMLLGGIPSPPMHQLVSVMNRESINHYAELLFRNAARRVLQDSPGSAQTGNVLLKRFMDARVGGDPDAVFASDGSGLSVLNRVTARSLVQLLSHAHDAPWSSTFHASLPVAGESELLRTRMRNTPAAGNLHAKTGTTNDIISLAGYVTADNGEILAFAFLYNGRDRWNAREALDVMGATMAQWGRD
ncbi:MAG TPA: D-alanyl-D-alanine carboxypeptidase/D-alanyl-D-alanine-endopeptidase [Gemmatimonadales bacterium]|nr:D-alanyl-D-alanine carboxypeptidase/D-alanyl-D-alanine-endopeptidase [Gemmatimonadales bacterium]